MLNLNAIKNISNLRITNGFFASSRRDNKKQLVLFAYYAPLEEDLNQRFHRLRHFLVDNYDPIIIWALDKKGFNFKDSFSVFISNFAHFIITHASDLSNFLRY